MDRSEIITLLKPVKYQDAIGVWHETTEEKDVFCQVESVTRAEFFEAGRNGLNPDFKMTIFFGDYDGETMLQYKGATYAVYRTYHAKTDVLELYVERKGGTNGK